MDSELRNNIHINKLCQFWYVTLWKISSICHKIDQPTCQIIVQALVLSKLDYCNSLLIGTVNYQLGKLQHIQNVACRIVCNVKKYDSITPHLKKLHWLKIQERIIYKVATIMFKCLKGTAPPYLKSLLPVQHSRALRSGNFTKIPVCRKKTSLALQGSFTLVGPQIWNELLVDVRECTHFAMFESKLKTFLFKHAYEL